MIERALLTYENVGRGIEGDPCRRVVVVHDANTLETLFTWDEWAERERERKQAATPEPKGGAAHQEGRSEKEN